MSVAMLGRIPRPGRYTLVAVGLAVVLLAACRPAQAQAPIPGQAYQIPAGYESYTPGTIVTFGGYSYVIQTNRTMVLAQQSGTTPSYVPPAPMTVYVTPGYSSSYYGYSRPWYGPGPRPWYGPGPRPWIGPRPGPGPWPGPFGGPRWIR